MSSIPRDTERRVGERRRTRRSPTADESWFGAFELDDAGNSALFEPTATLGESDLEASQFEDDSTHSDSRMLARQAVRNDASRQSGYARLHRAFIGARAVLGLALIATLILISLFGAQPALPVAIVSVAYAALSTSMWLLPGMWPAPHPQAMSRVASAHWLLTIGIDLTAFTTLHLLAPGSSLNYVALLVMPVLMAGVLTPRTMALATAAGVTLVLLGGALLAAHDGDPSLALTQAGLAGSGFFVLAALSSELAARLAREELTSRGSLEMARQQAQLNRLVIEEMQDGVLVIDRTGRVRAANPAARRLLAPSGMCRGAPFQMRGVAAWEGLVNSAERAFVDVAWPEAGRDVELVFEPGLTRTLRVRVRFTGSEPQAGEEFCVLFLEDVRNMQARSRQEKLAAMGRVSAGIAHEIRNPLAAIAQANALLAEDASDPSQRQLTKMVSDNVERLKHIVDDVLAAAPSLAHDLPPLDAAAQVRSVCTEWANAAGVEIGGAGMLTLNLAQEAFGVVFDAEHLRRVLVNLLDNAKRHASGAAGAIDVRVDSRDETRAFLSISSDGPRIPPDVERHLFEPFFSTRSRGTGLGLYICRELCERYGASIDYRLRQTSTGERNEFFVAMRRCALARDAENNINSLVTP
jgi:two-component system, NtrC family, sensor histidine kinase PilS